MPRTGVWIIGDQSFRGASSLVDAPADAPIVFVESKAFCSRRPYHWQKLVLILSVMRHFAEELRAQGRQVHYFRLADDFVAGLRRFVRETGIEVLRVMEPNDHDRAQAMPTIAQQIQCRIDVTENNQFLASHDDFDDWAAGKKSLVMEFFYRRMRQKLNVLIERDGSPTGGKWNYDALNRVGQVPPLLPIPPAFEVLPDAITRQVIDDVTEHFAGQCFGATDRATMLARFRWPVTPSDALALLRHFIQAKLSNFGPFEDAMSTRSWSMFHSHLSVPLNCGLISPKQVLDEVLDTALPAVRAGSIPLSSVEGFVRQLIGWREFMRAVYWREMRRGGQDVVPYTQRNELHANAPLPDFYWTADTDMNCLGHSVTSVIERAFSHHIPRLMVLSNFALLHGVSPQQVNEWFIYAYADGYEWVTTPNVVGMGLYADGGIVATKPYAAGGAYINKMSDYCATCRYNPTKASGDDACPFTRAYWPFIHRHRKRLASNPRTALPVRQLDRIGATEIARRQRQTQDFFESLKPYA